MSDSGEAQKILREHGRTFSWASAFLGRRASSLATRLYALCRHLDDLADEPSPKRQENLQQLHTALQKNCYPIHDPAFSHYQILKDQGVDLDPLRHLLDGLIADQRQVRLKDEKELLKYCYQVAGTVGLMMSGVLDVKDRAARKNALDLGIAMQMTNICRDVLEDARMGRVYLPADWINGLTAAEIADQSHDPRIRKLITEAQRKLLQRADQFYRSGAEGFPSLPFRARLSIRTAAVVYREIGTQILEGKVNWWEGRSVVTSSRKLNLTLAALTQGDALLTQQANESPDLPGELMQYALLKATP